MKCGCDSYLSVDGLVGNIMATFLEFYETGWLCDEFY